MQVSIETTSGLERKLTVGVPAEQIDKKVDQRLAEATKNIRLDGFRKGKVPLKVVRQRFGAGIRQEVVGDVINESFREAIIKEDIKPASMPSIEPTKNEPGQDLEFTATFEVYPEVELADLSKIQVKRPVADISDADFDKMLDMLRQQQAKWNEVEREAAIGDTVTIDYVGTRDGEEFDGGKAEGSDLELGSGQMIPGFEDGIVGMSKGETKVVALTFPEDYHAEDLKGAAVEFSITVQAVKEKTLPEMNEEFFALYGVNEGGEEKFREEVRDNMERELKNALQTKLKNRVMEQLLALHDVELPSGLVATEIQNLKQQMAQQFGGGQEMDLSVLPDEMFRDRAERMAALGLIMSEVVNSAEIEVDQDLVRAKIEEQAATYEQPQEVIDYYYNNKQLLQRLESAVLEDQVVEHLLQAASIEEESLSYEDALKPDAPAEAESSDDE